jgi:predicted phage tail protein
MTDRGYNNFYTPDEYESYQQCPLDNYGQTPEARLEETLIKFMEMQQQINQEQQQLNQEHQQYLKNSFARAKNLEIQLNQIAQHMANMQSMEVQINTQTTHEEDTILTKNEGCGESVKEVVGKNGEETMFKECGVEKIVEEPKTPHEIELPQEFPSTEEDDTVDNKEMMMDAEENEGLFCKEKSCEQKKEIENKAEIDRVIDEICALFNKKELRRIWTPQYLYLKFMEFLPNQRKKTDDVISVSFWPP